MPRCEAGVCRLSEQYGSEGENLGERTGLEGVRGVVSQHASGDVWTFGKAALRAISFGDGAGGDHAPPREGYSMQEIARRLGRAASTISRELRCGAPEVAVLSIVRRRSGTPSDLLVARSRRSSCSTRHCAPMWRNDCLASSSLRAELLFRARSCPGKDVGMDRGRTGGGPGHGGWSRSLAACRSTSRTMDDAHQPRSHLSRAVRPNSRGAAPRVDGLLADRAAVASAESAHSRRGKTPRS